MLLHLLKFNKEEVNRFGEALINLRQQISYCKNCHNISETEVCNICSDNKRDSESVCVVEDIRAVMAI